MNEVRMEYTEGLGRKAEVWVDGHLLCVCDGVSTTTKRCPPGEMASVKFSYLTEAGFSWEYALLGNPSRRKVLDPLRGWAYVGYGQVLQVMPVLVDFGVVTMQDANWSTEESLVGKYVKIPVDRLEITFVQEPDWPKEMR
jgi:hypothetical protein